MDTIYHVTQTKWDGQDLMPLHDMVRTGKMTWFRAIRSMMRRWDWTLEQAAEYFDRDDANQVHAYTDLETSREFMAEFAPNGSLLAINTDDYRITMAKHLTEDYGDGHVAINGTVPADLITEIK